MAKKNKIKILAAKEKLLRQKEVYSQKKTKKIQQRVTRKTSLETKFQGKKNKFFFANLPRSVRLLCSTAETLTYCSR